MKSLAAFSLLACIIACNIETSSTTRHALGSGGAVIPPDDDHDEPPADIDCSDGEYPWQDESGAWVCATPMDIDHEATDYEPDMPDPETVPDLECEIATVDKMMFFGATACLPAKPTLYRSVLRLYKFDIMVRGRDVGDHSTTKVTRYRWDWDATANAYKDPVVDAETMHANHWPKDDPRLKLYKYMETDRTDRTGGGFLAYPATANAYCPCDVDTGHVGPWDSCYVLTGSLFKHICHSDTRVQVRAFQSAAGKPVTLGDRCGLGVHERNAPEP